jgi:hypothetical protein
MAILPCKCAFSDKAPAIWWHIALTGLGQMRPVLRGGRWAGPYVIHTRPEGRGVCFFMPAILMFKRSDDYRDVFFLKDQVPVYFCCRLGPMPLPIIKKQQPG